MEDVFDFRGMIRKGTVQSVDDTGDVQMVTVKTSEGALYTAEVHQLFGHASVAPVDGCTAMLFCIGGDPANMVALLTNPSSRFGGQAQGESVLYDDAGNRVAIRSGGTIQILAATLVQIDVPSVAITSTGSVTITAPEVTITAPVIAFEGNLTVDGAITTTGTIHADGGVT